MIGPEEVRPFMVEVRTDKGFTYSTHWLTPDAADLIASKSRHPASPITAIVMLWETQIAGAE